MKDWLDAATEYAIIGVDTLALIVILFGTIEVVFGMIRAMFSPSDGQLRRYVWLRYARWLVAGLTFQLAADIIETAVTDSWQSIGRIGAIGAIRTFLNYFLERDLTEVRGRQSEVVDRNL